MSEVVHAIIPSGKNTSAILESILKMNPQCMFNQAVKIGIIIDDITQDGAKGNSVTNKGTNMKPKRIRSQPFCYIENLQGQKQIL